MKIVKIVAVVLYSMLFITLAVFMSGCQSDITLGSMSTKVLYKGENSNNEWKSRNAGMASQTGYRMSWGSYNQE